MTGPETHAKEDVADVSKTVVLLIPPTRCKKIPYRIKSRKTGKTSKLDITPDEPQPSPHQVESPLRGLTDLTIPSGIISFNFNDLEIGGTGSPPPVDDGSKRQKLGETTPQSKSKHTGSSGGAH